MDRRAGEAHWPSPVTPLEAGSLHQNQVVGSRDHLRWEKEEELYQHLEALMDREVKLIQMLAESWSEARLSHVDIIWIAATLSHERTQSKFFMNYSDLNYALF